MFTRDRDTEHTASRRMMVIAASLSVTALFLPATTPAASAADFDVYSLSSVGDQTSDVLTDITLSTTLSSSDTLTCSVEAQTINFWTRVDTGDFLVFIDSATTDANGDASIVLTAPGVFAHHDIMVEIDQYEFAEGDFCLRAYNSEGTATFGKYQPVTTVDCPASEQFTGAVIEPCTASTDIYDAALNETRTITPPTDMTLSYANNTYVGIATATGDYGGDAINETSTASDTFDITQRTMSIVGPGALVITSGTSAVLTATVTGTTPCVDSATVVFTIEDLFGGDTWTATVPVIGGVATYTVSPLIVGHVYSVTVSAPSIDIDGIGANECLGDADGSGSVTVADPNAASQGGGWYFANLIVPTSSGGNSKTNFGYTVNAKYDKRSASTTYSGNLLWTMRFNGQMARVKAKVTSYGRVTCPTSDTFTACAQLSGNGYLYYWVPAVDETPGYWLQGPPVLFIARAYDGGVARVCTPKGKKVSCSDTVKPDAFQMISLTSGSETMEAESPYALLRGGSVNVR